MIFKFLMNCPQNYLKPMTCLLMLLWLQPRYANSLKGTDNCLAALATKDLNIQWRWWEPIQGIFLNSFYFTRNIESLGQHILVTFFPDFNLKRNSTFTNRNVRHIYCISFLLPSKWINVSWCTFLNKKFQKNFFGKVYA